jgi:hypothetical protein
MNKEAKIRKGDLVPEKAQTIMVVINHKYFFFSKNIY